MENVDIGQLIYLGLFAVVLAGSFLVSQRQNMNKTLQMAAIWALIFLGGVAIFGMWDDLQQDLNPQAARIGDDGTIEVGRGPNGHYFLTLDINGAPIEFVVDTGASDMVLTRADAEAAGIDIATLDFMGTAMTANGPVKTASVRLDSVSLGPITDQSVYAVVNDGEMRESLLGMAYLERWGRIEITGGVLRLVR